jgi:hypothetical protein
MALHDQASLDGALISTIDRGNGQHNLVLLLVDQISAQQPGLEGIWLLISLPHSSTLTIVPVFPDQDQQVNPLSETFAMTENNQPGADFLNLLTERILWNDFLVIDRKGIAFVMDAFEAAAQDGQSTFPDIALAASPQLTLESQISLWQSMCDTLSRVDGRDEFENLYSQISAHFSTNLSWEELPLYRLGTENSEVKLGCEFPTLNLISP